jgi:inner membrane protein
MTAPNHIIGGIVITGLFGSFLNLNILANPIFIASTIFGSLIPDIDYTKSTIGKIFRPISKYLNRRFGHRTITHSLLAMFGSFLLFAIIEATFFDRTTTAKIYLLGFFSHLILDMMTVQGVPLFYPFLRNPCVLPGNPNARFKTGNLHSETMIFCFFLLSLVFLQPLFENGFWTQYNRYFGTPKHLASEFHKSPDALKVKYTVKKGTEIITGNGICIEANDDVIVLLEENGFHVLNKEKYTILEVLPEHIGQQLLFQTQHFMEISTDSLNQLVQQNPIKFLEIYSNQNFQVSQNNRYSNTRKFKVDYPSALFFKEEKNKINTPPPTLFFPNPRIKTMQLQMGVLKKKAQLSKLNHSKKQAQLDSLKSLFFTSENLTQREAIYQKIKQLEMTKLSVFDPTKIQELQAKLSEFQKADSNKLMAGNSKSSNLQDGNKNTKTSFTGTITFIILN